MPECTRCGLQVTWDSALRKWRAGIGHPTLCVEGSDQDPVHHVLPPFDPSEPASVEVFLDA